MGRHSKNRAYLNQIELIALNDFMRTLVTTTMVNGERQAVYAKPWSDAAVLKKMGEQIPHLTMAHVQGFRRRAFGDVARESKSTTPNVTVLRRLDHLEKWASSLDLGFIPPDA